MSRTRIDNRLRFTSAVALPLYLLLSACGGDGSYGVASTPPPPPPAPTPTPTPTPAPAPTLAQNPTLTPTPAPASGAYPVTRAGNYDLMGRVTIDPGTGNPATWTNRFTTPGEFTTTVPSSPDGGSSYSLGAPAGILPGGRTMIDAGPSAGWSINSNGYVRGGFQDAPPFGAGTNLGVSLLVDSGYSYVSMGYWSWPIILTGNPTNGTNFGQLLFVMGDRTPAAGIPASGTATYDAHSLILQSSTGALGIPFSLTADFGLRTIAARIDQDFKNTGGPGANPMDFAPIQGIHVSGSAPFTNNGLFNILLSGTVNFAYEYVPTVPPSEAAFGELNGAFFGPHAEQVGGTFFIQRTGDQLPLYQDGFVGQQRRP
jgi:hypothetical protein